jgi:MFS family permease
MAERESVSCLPCFFCCCTRCGCLLWKGLFVFCVAVSVSSLLSAFSPNYETLLILRGVVGFCISGVTQK